MKNSTGAGVLSNKVGSPLEVNPMGLSSLGLSGKKSNLNGLSSQPN